VQNIVSDGQIGFDRVALGAAVAAAFKLGDWCLRGRLVEDSIIDSGYPLQEMPRRRCGQRTEWRVRDADATLVLYRGQLMGGTLTVNLARNKYMRPLVVVDLDDPPAFNQALAWIVSNSFRTLNVAGPCESTRPSIYKEALRYLQQLPIA